MTKPTLHLTKKQEKRGLLSLLAIALVVTIIVVCVLYIGPKSSSSSSSSSPVAGGTDTTSGGGGGGASTGGGGTQGGGGGVSTGGGGGGTQAGAASSTGGTQGGGSVTTSYTSVYYAAVSSYTDSYGNAWSSAVGQVQGTTSATTNGQAVANTADDTLYQNYIASGTPYSVSFAIASPASSYSVTLLLAEDVCPYANCRVATYTVNGATCVQNLDILGSIGAMNSAYNVRCPTVSGSPSTIVVGVTSVVHSGKLAAVQIVPTSVTASFGATTAPAYATSVHYIAYPRPLSSYTDSKGALWTNMSPGFQNNDTTYVWTTTSTTIANTTDSALYLATVSESDQTVPFTLGWALSPGSYRVTLNLNEDSCTATRCRVFSVTVNGAVCASNIDIYSLAGAKSTAVALPCNNAVTVTASGLTPNLNLNFVATTAHAKVDSVLIVPA